jgi:SAM-dependent methyltransferase
MSRYDSFAKHYDHVVGDRQDVAQFLLKLISKYHRRAKTILELGCGSGSMLSALTKRYDCEGIDLSREMLQIAKKKAPKAVLHHGDISDFKLKKKFDVVVCPFDTINHITSRKKWRGVFERAHQHLNPGGVFIFDVNTEYKLECYSEDPSVTENNDDFISVIQVNRLRRFNYEIVLKRFERTRRGDFKLHQMVLPELVVPTNEILKDLSAHFRTVTMIDPDRRQPDAETDDLFFVCRSPRGV